jgi:hypothetical protein
MYCAHNKVLIKGSAMSIMKENDICLQHFVSVLGPAHYFKKQQKWLTKCAHYKHDCSTMLLLLLTLVSFQ